MVKSSHQQQLTVVALYFTFLHTEKGDPITSKTTQTGDLLILYKCKLLTLQIPYLCLLFLYHTAQTGPLFSHWKTKQNQTTKYNKFRITFYSLKLEHLYQKKKPTPKPKQNPNSISVMFKQLCR